MAVPEMIFKRWIILKYISAPAFIIFVSHMTIVPYIKAMTPGNTLWEIIRQTGLVLLVTSTFYYLLRLLCPKVLSFLSGNREIRN